jgi:hypothetical protein
MSAGSPMLLVVVLMLILLLMRLVRGTRKMHCPVLWGSTTGWVYHSFPLLALLVRTDGIIRDDDIAQEL